MKSRLILADHLVVLQYYGEKHLNKYCSIITYDCDRILVWDFNLHDGLSLHYLYVYIYHTNAPITMTIICFIFLKYFRLLMNFSHPTYLYVEILMQTYGVQVILAMIYCNFILTTLYV